MSATAAGKRGALATVQGQAAAAPKRGSPEATLSAKGGIGKKQSAFQDRVKRGGPNAKVETQARVANLKSTTKAGQVGARYGHYHTDNLKSAIHQRTKWYRDKSEVPSWSVLEARWCVPSSTIRNTHKLMTHDFVRGEGANYTWVLRVGEPAWRWDDHRLYERKPGKKAAVPPEVLKTFVGYLSRADDPKIARQFTVDEAAELLMGLMECYGVDCPAIWETLGGPTRSWWRWFWDQPCAAHLSKGIVQRLDEIRLTAQTEPAVRDWFSVVQDPLPEGDEDEGGANCKMGRTHEYGFMSVEGQKAYLQTEMPEFVPKTDAGEIDEDALHQLAWEMVHDPRRQANFDQKGHALGGKGKVTVIGTRGRKKVKRDVSEGRWLTICPLIWGDGGMGFCSFVVQGTIPVERTSAASAAAAEADAVASGDPIDTLGGAASWGRRELPVGVPTLRSELGDFVCTIGTTKTGYSNHQEHLAMFKAGVEEIKKKEPWRFPFVLYLDNWTVSHSPQLNRPTRLALSLTYCACAVCIRRVTCLRSSRSSAAPRESCSLPSGHTRPPGLARLTTPRLVATSVLTTTLSCGRLRTSV
jgi:hypothetical protein